MGWLDATGLNDVAGRTMSATETAQELRYRAGGTMLPNPAPPPSCRPSRAGGSAVRADRKRFGSTPGGWKVRLPVVPNLQPVGLSGAVRSAVSVGWSGYVGGVVNVARSVGNRLIMLLHMAGGIAIGVFQFFKICLSSLEFRNTIRSINVSGGQIKANQG